MIDDKIDVIERCIDRPNTADAAARDELVDLAYTRLRRIVENRMKQFARLARWEAPDDVAQEAAMKLWDALKTISPHTTAEFWAIAAEEVRRVLLDLIRHHFGRTRIAAYTELP